MADLRLATIDDGQGAVGAVVLGDQVHALPERTPVIELLADWDAALERLDGDVEAGRLGDGRPLAEARLLAPVLRPPNLYMAGANYADHAREMRGLGPDDPVERSPAGPFMFLKPTTTLVGHREPVVIGAGVQRLDWEIELGAVIARAGHRIPADRALDHVAGYLVINDLSARDRFRRENAEPPMTFDWFAQKGWATSCPAGPWLTPAREIADPGALAMRLTINGELEQDSNTGEMLFTLAEQIAYLSSIVPLVPGDTISTGTPAGVGMGKGRFLSDGDVMVAEIEGLGALESPVTTEG